MMYINKLTNEELRNLFDTFIGDAEIVELNITKGDNKVRLNGIIRMSDPYGDGDETDDIIETDEQYEVNDYEVFLNRYHGDKHPFWYTKKLRTALYAKFGEEYAKYYLLN